MTQIKVKVVDNIPKGYAGMNKYAARALGIRFPYPENVVTVKKWSHGQDETIKHERVERRCIKQGGSYTACHEKANKEEKKVQI